MGRSLGPASVPGRQRARRGAEPARRWPPSQAVVEAPGHAHGGHHGAGGEESALAPEEAARPSRALAPGSTQGAAQEDFQQLIAVQQRAPAYRIPCSAPKGSLPVMLEASHGQGHPHALPRARLRLVLLTASSGALAQQDLPPAGRIKVAAGDGVTCARRQATPAIAGALVFEADVLRTGPDGRLSVMLKDESRVSLGPNTRTGADPVRLLAGRRAARSRPAARAGRAVVRVGAHREAGARGRAAADAHVDHRRARHARARAGGGPVTRRSVRCGGRGSRPC